MRQGSGKMLLTDGEAVNIKMPVVYWADEIEGDGIPHYGVLEIDWASKLTYRRAVWSIARYFRREEGYDFVQYGHEGREDDLTHRAYLWLHPNGQPGYKVHAIGAGCFRKRPGYKDERAPPEFRIPHWAMQWIWLHPYFRRQGLLSRAWPHFRKTFGDFEVEGPYSDAMVGFLKRQGNHNIADAGAA